MGAEHRSRFGPDMYAADGTGNRHNLRQDDNSPRVQPEAGGEAEPLWGLQQPSRLNEQRDGNEVEDRSCHRRLVRFAARATKA
jgi:hypothetical protein